MKTFFTAEKVQKLMKLAGVYHFLVGLLFLCFSHSILPESALVGQILGSVFLSFALGFLLISSEPEANWPTILIAFIFKLISFFLVAKSFLFGSIPQNYLWFSVINDLLWIVPFYFTLIHCYEFHIQEESAPKKFHDLIKYVRTNDGVTLLELSKEKNVFLIFVRHFGCTFCRETVAEISKLDKALKDKNLTPVFVHMSDPCYAKTFFSKYFDYPVAHVSDPSRALYKSLNLKRGSIYQLVGPKMWWRGVIAGFMKGHGLGELEGDALQLGGYFILSHGEIVFEHRTTTAADSFDLDLIPKT